MSNNLLIGTNTESIKGNTICNIFISLCISGKFYISSSKMKNNKLTWLLLAVLLFITASYFLFVHDKQNSSYSNADFALTDTSSLTKIVFTDVDKGSKKVAISLERQADSSWRVNGKYAVLEPQLHYFFKAISQLKVKEKLTDAGNTTTQKRMEDYHLLVEFYNGKERVKAYQLGTEAKDHEGSVMRMLGADKAFIVSIPGTMGLVNTRFPTQIQFWRENLLFDGHIQDIQSIELISHKNEAASFSYQRASPSAKWTLNGKEIDSIQVKPYLRNLRTKVYAETFASNDFPNVYTNLQTQIPDFHFNVKYFKGKERSIRLYLRPDNKNNFFGWVEGENDLLTIQHFVMDRFINPEGKEQIVW